MRQIIHHFFKSSQLNRLRKSLKRGLRSLSRYMLRSLTQSNQQINRLLHFIIKDFYQYEYDTLMLYLLVIVFITATCKSDQTTVANSTKRKKTAIVFNQRLFPLTTHAFSQKWRTALRILKKPHNYS